VGLRDAVAFTGGQLQPSKRLAAPRGLTHSHSHDLKSVFKGAAMQAGRSSRLATETATFVKDGWLIRLEFRGILPKLNSC
jgi:hypothetical protein